MNFHNILHDDMRNGEGLRVVLFVSGCTHYCDGCHNPQTWGTDTGVPFDEKAKKEIYEQLAKEYIRGITFSGGDPLYEFNLKEVNNFCSYLREKFPNKTIWIYTGYTWENILNNSTSTVDRLRESIVLQADVLVDGAFKKELASIEHLYAGSTNQRVIDVTKSLKEGKVVLWK